MASPERKLMVAVNELQAFNTKDVLQGSDGIDTRRSSDVHGYLDRSLSEACTGDCSGG
jgi:hypothetical protein